MGRYLRSEGDWTNSKILSKDQTTTVKTGNICTSQDRVYTYVYRRWGEATDPVSDIRLLIRPRLSGSLWTPHRFLHVSSLLDIRFEPRGLALIVPLGRMLVAARFLSQAECRNASDQDLSACAESHICSKLQTRLKLLIEMFQFPAIPARSYAGS
jgi:hypothetical protein